MLFIQDLNLFKQKAWRQVLWLQALSLRGIFVLVFISGCPTMCLLSKIFKSLWLTTCFGRANILIYLSYASPATTTIILIKICWRHETWRRLVQRSHCGCNALKHVVVLSSDYRCIKRWELLAWQRKMVKTRLVIVG